MSRTDLDPSTLAKALRRMAGDGSIKWVHEPIQASVLLKFHERNDELRAENAKLLDEKIDAYNEKVVAQLEADELRAENSKLRKRVAELDELLPENGRWYRAETVEAYVTEIAKLRELVADMWLQLLNAYDRKEVDEFADRMRELGVVVTNG